MIGAKDVDGEEFAASICGSLWDPQEDVGTKPERLFRFSELRRFLKSFLKRRDAPKNLQPKPEESGTNDKSSWLEWSSDSQRSDQSNRLRPNFSADHVPSSTEKRLQEMEEGGLDFEWEEDDDDDDSRDQSLRHR